MMRTLLILVCTINLFLTGCKTGQKATHCTTGCCEVSCGPAADGCCDNKGNACCPTNVNGCCDNKGNACCPANVNGCCDTNIPGCVDLGANRCCDTNAPSCCVPVPGCGVPVNGCAAVHVGVAPQPEKQDEEIKPVHLEEPKVALEEKVIPAKQPVKPEPAPLQIPEYAHARDYGWLVGQLQRVHSPQHQWKIRFAALDENAEWGGSMVLAPDVRLDDWKDGDLVYVEGEILKDRPSVYLAGALYRVRHIRPAQDAPPVVVNYEK